MKQQLKNEFQPGDRAKAHSIENRCLLPDGLPENAKVTVLSYDRGYYQVQYLDRAFTVFMGCLEKD